MQMSTDTAAWAFTLSVSSSITHTGTCSRRSYCFSLCSSSCACRLQVRHVQTNKSKPASTPPQAPSLLQCDKHRPATSGARRTVLLGACLHSALLVLWAARQLVGHAPHHTVLARWYYSCHATRRARLAPVVGGALPEHEPAKAVIFCCENVCGQLNLVRPRCTLPACLCPAELSACGSYSVCKACTALRDGPGERCGTPPATYVAEDFLVEVKACRRALCGLLDSTPALHAASTSHTFLQSHLACT